MSPSLIGSESWSREDLAQLGGGKLAYVRSIRSEDVPRLFPRAPALKPGLRLFALHAADGTPILVTETIESARLTAQNKALEPVFVQ